MHGAILVRMLLIEMTLGPFNMMGVKTAALHLSTRCNAEVYANIMAFLDDSSSRWRRVHHIYELAKQAFRQSHLQT